ncbi:patatin-like phospholipase family protein [Clostridium sp.]|uniref:patatin-like phospholipase family protein n=1 Tax=Clostridium sp. TaxID=1506 RepID=UPI001B7CB2E3|nr:patatin-like phospholipase family protein [Clostridium sp.]MBP3917196.1 patatin-like phospholipase family protein [Clostridium sp.]
MRKILKKIAYVLIFSCTFLNVAPIYAESTNDDNEYIVPISQKSIGRTGSITIKYVDENGEELDAYYKEGLKIGEYQCLSKEIEGYSLSDDDSKNIKLTLISKNKTVNFNYVKDSDEVLEDNENVEEDKDANIGDEEEKKEDVTTDKKTAIVLGAGGSRGAYEIGVWKALNELGIDYDIVVGASIGSVNGAIMTIKDYDKAYELWTNVTVNDITTENINVSFDIDKIDQTMSGLKEVLKVVGTGKGADITPFENLLKNNLDLDAFYESDIEYALLTTDINKFKGVLMTKDLMTKENVIDYIIASSSMYPVFPIKTIDGVKYVDGGYTDSVPISYARELGAEEIIAVDLNPSVTHKDELNNENVKYIQSSWDLGSFIDFSSDLTLRNINLGYNDTMKAYGKYGGFKYTFTDLENYSDEKAAAEFTESINKIKEAINNLKSSSSSKSFVSSIDDLLAEGTFGKELSERDMLIKGSEVSAELAGLNGENVSEYEDFIKDVKNGLRYTNYLSVISGATKLMNTSDYSNIDIESYVQKNKKALTAYASYLVKKGDEASYEKLAKISKFAPSAVIAGAYLNSIK